MVASGGQKHKLYVSADKGPRIVRQEIQSKKLSKFLTESMPQVLHRVHRAEGFLSVEGIPIVRIDVGNSKHEATKVQWSDAATDNGAPVVVQRQIREAWASAFADPTSAACWR